MGNWRTLLLSCRVNQLLFECDRPARSGDDRTRDLVSIILPVANSGINLIPNRYEETLINYTITLIIIIV
jgi:hypothetical protein